MNISLQVISLVNNIPKCQVSISKALAYPENI
jgi:hypothetical protein